MNQLCLKAGKEHSKVKWLFNGILDAAQAGFLQAEDLTFYKLKQKGVVTHADKILYKQELLAEFLGPCMAQFKFQTSTHQKIHTYFGSHKAYRMGFGFPISSSGKIDVLKDWVT